MVRGFWRRKKERENSHGHFGDIPGVLGGKPTRGWWWQQWLRRGG